MSSDAFRALGRNIRYLVRSKSFQFMRDSQVNNNEKIDEAFFVWEGKKIFYRPHTLDTTVIHNILLKPDRKKEYYLPFDIKPAVILDIGGNIGVASLYLNKLFPQARIFTFEPFIDNYNLLLQNTAAVTNISPHNIAIGAQDGEINIYIHDNSNFGGITIIDNNNLSAKKNVVRCRSLNSFLAEQNIQQVDLIKIDTEGAEYEILTSMDERYLREVKWIIGELHGYHDYELLAYLSQWFHIGVSKGIKTSVGMFNACNKQYDYLIN